MLRPLPPAAAAAAAVLVFATVSAVPAAHADDGSFLGTVECGSSGGNGCQILLRWLLEHGGLPGVPGTGGNAGPGGNGGTGGSGGSGGDDSGEYGDVDWDAIDWDSMDWSQIDWDDIDWDAVFAEADEGGDGGEGTDPLTLLEESMASFELPEPKIATSPGTGSLVLVNTPLWLWVESEDWDAESVSAQLGSTTLTVTATPVRTAWTMGDGSTVECEGPGTPFDASVHAAASASPDCGHVYTSSSDTAAGGTRTVTVRVLWNTEWSFSDGGSGSLDQLISTSEVGLTVRESHGLVTDTQ